MLEIESKEEKNLTGDRPQVLAICLLSSLDAKYNKLALTLEYFSVNILNMDTGFIVKIFAVPQPTYICTDS